MRPLHLSLRSVACMKRRSHSWYWRDPLWTSSWDAPGSPSFLRGDLLKRILPSTLPHRTSMSTPQVTGCPEGNQMDQGKVRVITDRQIPQPIKELQRILGFANFYRRFIKYFSLLTAPLTSMLRGKPKSLS